MRNLEIKIAVAPERLAALEAIVRNAGLPIDALRQVDTYFAVTTGRLKLRETTRDGGQAAAELIAYRRPDERGPRWSDYDLLPLSPRLAPRLKVMLSGTIGVTTVVAKRRLVAIRDRSRVHLDQVDDLGCFLEIETVACDGDEAGIDRELAATLEWLGVEPATEAPIRGSYADLRRDRAGQGEKETGLKIGIALPITQTDDGEFHRYRELRDMALNAEQAGFDSVWVFDHLLYRSPDKPARGVWEAWTVLSALAEATSRVELGTLVLCTAFRNPAVLAKMADALDEVSAGRLILGLGAGWNEPEFEAFGIPFDHLASRFEEAISIILPLLREGAVDYAGTYYQAPNCVSLPRGPRPGGPPILLAGSGPRMLRLIARHADAWNTCWIGTPALLPERVAKLEAACLEVGRDPKSIEVTVGVTVAYPDLNPDLPERLHNPDYALLGSPEEIAAGFRAHKEAGVSHLICVTNPFTAPALERLAEAYRAYRQG